MKITDKIESRERCAEAGWYAYDYLLDQPIDKKWILALQPLGSFIYLPMLIKPFFKIETDHYMIKGMEGDNCIRVAIHNDYMKELDEIEEFLSLQADNSADNQLYQNIACPNNRNNN